MITIRWKFIKFFFHGRLSSIKCKFPLKVSFHGSSFFNGFCPPYKIILHQWLSHIKSQFPSKVFSIKVSYIQVNKQCDWSPEKLLHLRLHTSCPRILILWGKSVCQLLRHSCCYYVKVKSTPRSVVWQDSWTEPPLIMFGIKSYYHSSPDYPIILRKFGECEYHSD